MRFQAMNEEKRRPKGRKRLAKQEDDGNLDNSSSGSEGNTDSNITGDGRKRRRTKKIDLGTKRRRKEKRESSEPPPSPPKEVEVEKEVEVKVDLRNYTPFQLFCDFILRKFMQKDPEEFFTHPVNASDAPGYFQVITSPMDYSTINSKIVANLYSDLSVFKSDFALVATNAMTYNNPNTVYYLAALKLQTLIRYYFSNQYIEYVKYSLPFGHLVPHDIIGLTPKVPVKALVSVKRNERAAAVRDAVVDSCNAKDLLSGSLAKHKGRLIEKKPEWKMGYLDKKEGGLVLNVVTGAEHTPVRLGDAVGPLERGVPTFLSDYKPVEKSENIISYTKYGPYASFAPQYDLTWSSMSKRDSDLLISCYGDKTNATDAMALRQMALDTSTSLLKSVDGMLNVLTNGDHARVLQELGEPSADEEAIDVSLADVLNSVESLSNLGLDLSFVNEMKVELGLTTKSNPTSKLVDETGQMISDLNVLQKSRLGQSPATSLADQAVPSQAETQLAGRISDQIAAVVQQAQVPPGDLVSTQQVHQAMGVNTDDFDYDLLAEFMVVT